MIKDIIQEKFLQELNYPEAAALSVVLMVAMLVLATVYARILGTEDDSLTAAIWARWRCGRPPRLAPTIAPLHKPNKRWTRFILPGFTWLMILYLTLPIFMMILYSFNDIPVVGVPATDAEVLGLRRTGGRTCSGSQG